MSEEKKEFVVWIDLETTGLSPQRDHILEVALYAEPLGPSADPGRMMNSFHAILEWPEQSVTCDSVVFAMHGKNGLFYECASKEPVSGAPARIPRDKIEQHLIDYLRSAADEVPAIFYFAGSSVHFDRDFCRLKWPVFSTFFSHRVLDVSALVLSARHEGMLKPPKRHETTHRALADLEDSHAQYLETLSWFRSIPPFPQLGFQGPPGPNTSGVRRAPFDKTDNFDERGEAVEKLRDVLSR